jgi:predicted acylesterase/phospholipase RssA
MRALVLSGAVAKGAFEAGVISGLAEQGITFDTIVGTSAGALNGAVTAAGLAGGRVREAASTIEKLWREEASWFRILSPTLSLRGFSTTSRVRDIVVRALGEVVQGPQAVTDDKIDLTLVAADLHGTVNEDHLTYESSFTYGAADLLNTDKHREIAEAAAASAAFPILFVPPVVAGRSRVDGGAVNNAPISYVLDGMVARPEIFVVLAEHEPRDPDTNELIEPNIPAPELWGPALVGQLADIAINERISRDLFVAEKRNQKLVELESTLAELRLPPDQQTQILSTLGWRHLDIVVIRPLKPLEGSSFRGFFSRGVREKYIQAGKDAAYKALADRASRADLHA